MTKKEAWKIFDESPSPTYYWEHEDSGLLLAICPKCGVRQTRETYLRGFWAKFYTLKQDCAVMAIAQHSCGQWVKVYA
jgi:hypothetical protein